MLGRLGQERSNPLAEPVAQARLIGVIILMMRCMPSRSFSYPAAILLGLWSGSIMIKI